MATPMVIAVLFISFVSGIELSRYFRKRAEQKRIEQEKRLQIEEEKAHTILKKNDEYWRDKLPNRSNKA